MITPCHGDLIFQVKIPHQNKVLKGSRGCKSGVGLNYKRSIRLFYCNRLLYRNKAADPDAKILIVVITSNDLSR